MIKVHGIHKSFGKVRAVRGVSFDAPDGKITGLLGPNGAGKSTTLRILYTVLRPDEGSASIDGYDVVDDYMYFKAGAYNQNSTGSPDDFVQVTFYELEASHDDYGG